MIRIQTEFQMKENLYTEKIESLVIIYSFNFILSFFHYFIIYLIFLLQKRVSNEKNNDIIAELENKLKTEQIRRQHLQTRLLAEESIHQKEINELETKLIELSKLNKSI